MKEIRVRYAPSPTGFLHIGNARTALFNYLFACHNQGNFIIRIEDTDLVRNNPESEKHQLEELKWLGIKWSEGPDIGGQFGPYRQSERIEIYNQFTQQLLDRKLAYKVYTPDKSKFVIRFKVPNDKNYKFHDLIRGTLTFESKYIEDWIIVKSNGFPTYNYAVAIDDHLMKISHIFRGEEHITNTPKQIMIYQAFNWEIPIFSHISLIINQEKKKLSKRDNDNIQFIQKYKDLGYLPQALFNFLALLGFDPQSENKILNKKEIVILFDTKRLIKAPAIFDIQKLSFINSQHLNKLSLEELTKLTKPFFLKENIFLKNEWLSLLISLFRNRINFIQELIELYKKFFLNKIEISKKSINFLQINQSWNKIQILYNMFERLKNFKTGDIKETVQQFQKQTQLKSKICFMTIRIACTHTTHGPQLFLYLELLGKNKVLAKIKKILKFKLI